MEPDLQSVQTFVKKNTSQQMVVFLTTSTKTFKTTSTILHFSCEKFIKIKNIEPWSSQKNHTVYLHIISQTIEFFLNNTNLTFLAFLYKIDIEGIQNQQKESCLHWEWNLQHQPSMDYNTNCLIHSATKDICWIAEPWTELGSFQVQ